MDREPLLLRVKEVMALTGISRSKLYEFLRSGELRSLYVGRSRRVRREDLGDFIEKLPGDRIR